MLSTIAKDCNAEEANKMPLFYRSHVVSDELSLQNVQSRCKFFLGSVRNQEAGISQDYF